MMRRSRAERLRTSCFFSRWQPLINKNPLVIPRPRELRPHPRSLSHWPGHCPLASHPPLRLLSGRAVFYGRFASVTNKPLGAICFEAIARQSAVAPLLSGFAPAPAAKEEIARASGNTSALEENANSSHLGKRVPSIRHAHFPIPLSAPTVRRRPRCRGPRGTLRSTFRSRKPRGRGPATLGARRFHLLARRWDIWAVPAGGTVQHEGPRGH